MRTLRGGLLTLLLVSTPAWCETVTDVDVSLELNSIGAPVSAEVLGSQRGKQGFDFELHANFNDQAAQVSRNLIRTGSTGNNIISDQAFTDATGNVTVIQNSGNGVAIQSSTLINLSVEF